MPTSKIWSLKLGTNTCVIHVKKTSKLFNNLWNNRLHVSIRSTKSASVQSHINTTSWKVILENFKVKRVQIHKTLPLQELSRTQIQQYSSALCDYRCNDQTWRENSKGTEMTKSTQGRQGQAYPFSVTLENRCNKNYTSSCATG